MTVQRIAHAGPVAVAMALILLAGCASTTSSPQPSTASSSAKDVHSASATHTPPAGATGEVGDAAWAISDRLTAPTYTTDTTAAVVEGLARAGIATLADTTSSGPDQAVTGAASPFRLLDFQAHALAVGVWADSRYSGAELDTVVPLPAGLTGLPTTSELLAAYVASADSAGGELSRALMAGQDLLSPERLQFPAIVLVLFTSDLATDGGHQAALAPGPAVAPAGAVAGTLLTRLDMGVAGSGHAPVEIELAASGGVCSDKVAWISGAIGSLFAALKLATPANLPGAILTGIWNWLVSTAESIVRGLIRSVTDVVLGTVRSIAAAVAAVAVQIASLVPYALKVTASGDSGGPTFALGPDPLSGTFTAAVSAGDLPEWPAVLVDCAAAAEVALADFHSKDIPLTWGPLQAAGDPLLSPIDSVRTNDVTDASGRATWGFLTSRDPGDPTGEQRTQIDSMPVSIHRPEVEAARAKVTDALLGFIPTLLRPFVDAIFRPYVDGLQARLNTILDVRGSGTADLVYHDGASPKPSMPNSPGPSGVCDPNPVTPGTYTGTTSNSFSETIDLGAAFGGVVTHTDGTGHATIIVASDGSLTGTWDLVQNEVFDETASVDGTPMLKDHRIASYGFSGTSVTGTACNLGLGYGTVIVSSCVDSLKGDCSDEPMPIGTSPVPGGMGPPSSVTGDRVTWTFHYGNAGDATVTDDFTVVVSRQ